MNVFIILTILFTISSIFSFINSRWIKLPGVIGVMVLAIITALVTLFAGKSLPKFSNFILNFNNSINFSDVLLDILLGFLLFASALHFDFVKLKENFRGILLISTVGVLLSTLIFAGLFYYILVLLGLSVPFIYCLVFGALISPTDAVAVAALLKKTRMPARLETIINGESLFNDGIGIVLFVTFAGIAATPDAKFSMSATLVLFAKEVFGGLILGLVFGAIAQRMMRAINDFQTIVMISITLVMVITVTAGLIHASTPLAVVAAGLIVGNRKFKNEPERKSRDYLEKIWKLFDELLNTILFVLIGFQMISVSFTNSFFIAGVLAIIALLVARMLSITLPVFLANHSLKLPYNSIFILTWGGLRGGISVALALSLPHSIYRDLILSCSFFIVIFSIVIQGLTLNKVVDKLL